MSKFGQRKLSKHTFTEAVEMTKALRTLTPEELDGLLEANKLTVLQEVVIRALILVHKPTLIEAMVQEGVKLQIMGVR